MPTKIEWAQASWSPVTGCDPNDGYQSEACTNCWARRMAHRLKGRYGYPADEPFRVTFHENRLNEPLRMRMGKRIFVCSMGDLFHNDVKTEWIYEIFRVMEQAPYHRFLLLTKRPKRMKQLINGVITGWEAKHRKHIWLGITAENQTRFIKRYPSLAEIDAKVRFLSTEPLLGPIAMWGATPDWVITGCESGPKRRPSDIQWFRYLRDQCAEAGVPFFLKQMEIGGKVVKMPKLDGRIHSEMPGD